MERKDAPRSLARAAALAAFAVALGFASPLLADGGGGGGGDRDRTQEALDRAARDAERAQERALRDEARYAEDRAEILARNADDPIRQQEELARLEADHQRDLIRQQEEAARDAADLAEELQKIEEDLAEDRSGRSEDRADFGSSAEMHDLAEDERPEFDPRGFPVRHGEVVALNLSGEGLAQMQQRGFRVIAQDDLPSLASRVTRLAAPEEMDAGQALAEARTIEPGGTFDYTHYYRMQFNASGAPPRAGRGSLERRSGRLTIGMIDTAVVNHPFLRSTSLDIRDFGSGAGAVPTGHGTAVASILASEGASRILVANVFRGTGAEPFTSADALAHALEWMVANGVPVVNMSLAGPRNAILDRLIEQAVGRGTIIVAAAGNGGPTAAPAYPAALRPVVAVTAVDGRNRIYRYANQGNYITISARGVDEPAADSSGGISLFSGTSFATPHVAAWMARCLASSSSATDCARRLRSQARDLGEPGYDPVYGHGLVAG